MPKYRLVAPPGERFAIFRGMVQRPGLVVDWDSWPNENMEPVDEPARRISDYARAHRHDGNKPLTPFDRDHDRFYLPAVIPWQSAQPAGLREGVDVLPGMPTYETRYSDFAYRGRTIPAKTPFAWVAWPTWGFQPVNEPAQQVVAYLELNRDHPALAASPWNQFDDSLWLHDLPQRASAHQPSYLSDHRGDVPIVRYDSRMAQRLRDLS